MYNNLNTNHMEQPAGMVPMLRPAAVCANCGAPLTEQQSFCPQCGAPKNGMLLCTNCGAVLQPWQRFCPMCGHQAGLPPNNHRTSSKNKSPLILVIIIVILALAAFAAVKVAPKLFMNTAEYIEQGDLEKAWRKARTDEEKQLVIDANLAAGNYQEAYEKALTDEDKLAVIIENHAAVQSAFSIDYLKNPTSFSLRDAFFYIEKDGDEETSYLTLYISGANSYGGIVSNYWLYIWDQDNKAWEIYCSVSDLEEEEYSDYDDVEDIVEKSIDNIGRSHIQECIHDGTKLSKDAINRINKLFEIGKLNEVQLLDITSEESADTGLSNQELNPESTDMTDTVDATAILG